MSRPDTNCGHCWGAGHRRTWCPYLELPVVEARMLTPFGRSCLAGWRIGAAHDIAAVLRQFPQAEWEGFVTAGIERAAAELAAEKVRQGKEADDRARREEAKGKPRKRAEVEIAAEVARFDTELRQVEQAHTPVLGTTWSRTKAMA